MNNISIVIPFHTDHGPREKVFKWIKGYYQKMFPMAEICIGTSGTSFNKSIAVNRAVQTARGNILVIVDADIICSSEVMYHSIQLLSQYPWIIPYKMVLDISKNTTINLLKTSPEWPFLTKVDASKRDTGKTIPVGGINIMKKECFETVGGFDERFKGWGGEDDAFTASLNTLCGHYVRTRNSIYHLWHPTSHLKDNEHYKDNLQLALRYCRAQGNVQETKKIIDERQPFL